jgi:hypothetical protein
MSNLYNIEVHDNLISIDQQKKLWEYLENQTWHQAWTQMDQVLNRYIPKYNSSWVETKLSNRLSSMPRCTLASDEDSLKKFHLPVYIFWKVLNQKLGNQYTLNGYPEGMYDSEAIIPATTDPALESGWRVYANATHSSNITGPGYIHRDSANLSETDCVTILYFLNTEWYPSWMADLRFYPNDDEHVTKDQQQFNRDVQQQRNYAIGWLDQGRIVSPVPGRLLIYDSRCLHSTMPAHPSVGYDKPSIKLAFRARRKN